MFTGIVTDIGRVAEVVSGGDTRFSIETGYDTDAIEIGASIACDGACLTVVATQPGRFSVTASAETLACTTLGDWSVGRRINLERALKVGDELGGHIVAGHVDGVGEIAALHHDGESLRVAIFAPAPIARFIAAKGSVALDGVSLTVNEVERASFGVNLIPHTRAVTTLGALGKGAHVNLEIDVLARYVARLAEVAA
jgi:riboflavin synthase